MGGWKGDRDSFNDFLKRRWQSKGKFFEVPLTIWVTKVFEFERNSERVERARKERSERAQACPIIMPKIYIVTITYNPAFTKLTNIAGSHKAFPNGGRSNLG